ncbi:DoxX family protein [Alicyclobacillus acidiphilus]|uniref:DoxX family protein n=1 Tax=Alicyclobacillus acidiphilus TaxID=182455 RepID=UPI00082BAD9E|nr:DoxX family protein [Alicyclobacillus acidiphilus]
MVKLLRENVYARCILTALRIWIGVEWVRASLEKIGSPAWTGAQAGTGVDGFLKGAIAQSTGPHATVQAWYATFVKDFALPHAKLFSYTVSFGELLVGIALVLGCLTTFAALMGIVMNMAYLLAGTSSTNPNMIVWQMILLIAGFNAAYFGLDYFIIPWLRKFVRRVEGSFQRKTHMPHKLSA